MKALSLTALVFALTVPTVAQAQQNSGLLGKAYVYGAYRSIGVDTPGASFDGFDGEVNAPLNWLQSQAIGVDIFANYRHLEAEAFGMDLGEVDNIDFGARLYANTNSNIRPFVSLGASTSRTTNINYIRLFRRGTIPIETTSTETDFLLSLGAEALLSENLSLRGDFRIDTQDSDGSYFDGTAALWLSPNFFLRGGFTVPMDDDLSTGGIIGGGVSF